MKKFKNFLRQYFLLILANSFLILSCVQYRGVFFEVQPPQPSPERISTGFDITQIYQQITTHPEADMFPAISPDGKWIAFASKRSGNMDIWVKPVAGGSAVQITTHKSDDIMPCWAPNGKNLVFVSYREDAQGDLWIVPIKMKKYGVFASGEPLRITKYLGADLYPAFSPDGKYLAFASDRDGVSRLYVIRMRNWSFFQLSAMKATHPSWSPDGKYLCFAAFVPPKNLGRIFIGSLNFSESNIALNNIQPVTDGSANDAFPSWHPKKNEIYFTRYARDTNGDGNLTPEDQPELWKINLVQDKNFNRNTMQNGSQDFFPADQMETYLSQRGIFQEMKLIPDLEYDYYPVCSPDSLIYFISRRNKNEDIFAINENGAIPKYDDPFVQFEFAKTYFPLPEEDLLQQGENSPSPGQLAYRLLAFQRVFDFFPEQQERFGNTYYELARTYALMGDTLIARSYLEEIIQLFPQDRKLFAKASLQLFLLDFKQKKDSFFDRVTKLEKIKQKVHGDISLESKCQLFLAELYFKNKKYSKAIEKLEELIANYPQATNRCARAQLLIGDIFSIFGQKDEVLTNYLKVIRQYPGEPKFVNLALDRILKLFEEKDPNQSIASLRLLIQNYSGYRRLAARAKYRIAEIFYEQLDFDAATRELRSLLSNFFDLPNEAARALLFLGKVFEERGEDIGAIKSYRQVIDQYGTVQNSEFSIEAEERLFDFYLKTGANFQRFGEAKAAYNRFRSAVALYPQHLEANRGMIASLYRLGKIDDAIRLYENRLLKYPFNEKYLYLLGLCFSYKATEKSDRTGKILDLNSKLMEKSVQLIEKSLSKDYRMIQAYLTLSFNYESLERYAAAKEKLKKPFLERVTNAVIAPVKSILRTITFRKQREQKRYYEKAIDALTTAIALNDESRNPKLESELALNLASNFYNLQEFGFELAYHYYQLKLKYDSTFVNKRAKAEVFQKMGHCAFVVEDIEKGPAVLKQAIKLMTDLGNETAAVVSKKRLALLYQLAGENDLAIEYFKEATKYDEKKRLYNQLEIDYRNIAYNFLLLNDEEEAERYAREAIRLIQNGRAKKITAEPNWIKIGILGWEIPVYNLGQISAGQSTAAGGFTTEEEVALIYSILGNAALGKRNLDHAIAYFKKKLEIYRQKKDRIAEAVFLNNIGYLFYLRADYSEAWEYFYHSYQICRKREILPGQVMNAVNLSALAVLVNKLKLLPDTTSIAVDEKAERRLLRSLEIHQEVIPQIEELPYGFRRELAQIYLLNGNLHYLQSVVPQSVSDTLSLESQFSNYLNAWGKWLVADSCFHQAEKLCKENNLKDILIHVDHNRALISMRLGELNDALKRLISARKLAYRTNDYQRLWEIDFSLAKLSQVTSGEKNFQLKKPEFYFYEAIQSLDRSVLSDKKYRISPIYMEKIRQFFEAAVEFELEKGNEKKALLLTEKFRGFRFLTLISNHRLQLKKERHKIFLGNARYLAREIARLDEKIRLAHETGNASKQEVVSWTGQKKNFEKEFARLRQDLHEEDPELLALISSDPVTISDIQKILDDEKILVNYFFTNQTLNIWIVRSDSTYVLQKSCDPVFLSAEIEKYNQQIDSVSAKDSGRNLWQILLEPVASEIANRQTVVFIADDFIAKFPFNYFVQFSAFAIPGIEKVVMASDFAGYYYGFQNRKIKGDYFWANDKKVNQLISELGYNVNESTKPYMTKADFVDKLSAIDFAVLNAGIEENQSDPLMSKFAILSKERTEDIYLRNIFELNFNGSVAALILNNDLRLPIVRILLERSLIYSGAPSLILGRKTVATEKFLEYFYDYLFDYPASEALYRAQRMMAAENYPPSSYAFFQAVGFEGMTDSQEEEFARQRFVTKVMVGNQYYEQKKWDDALNAYEQALVMAKKQGDREAINNLYQLIINSAANGKMWDRAILYQKVLYEIARDEQNTGEMVQQLRYLIYFYTQNKEYNEAIEYQNQYLQIAKKFQQKEEIADSYRRLGLIYEQSRDYGAAVENFTSAIAGFRSLRDSLMVAECLKNRGRIFLLYLDQYGSAIQDQEEALQIFEKSGDVQNSLEVIQNVGLSHERLANYQKALELQLRGYELAKKLNSSQWIALSLQYLANIYWKMADYQQALQHQKKALNLFHELKNKKFQEVALSTLGLIYMSLGNIGEALANEMEALMLAKEIQSLIDQATIHKNLAMMLRVSGKMEDASYHLREAMALDQKAGALRGLSYDYRDLGKIQLAQGDFTNGYRNIHKALKLSRKINDGRNYVQSLYEIGVYHLKKGTISAAIDTLQLAGQLAEQLFVPEVSWRSFFSLGKIYREQGRNELCEKSFIRSMETIETMRSKIKIEEYKSGFIDDKLDVYYELIDFYLAIHREAKAFDIAERAKSRNFADLLANKKITFRGPVSEEDFQKKRQFEEKMNQLQNEIGRLKLIETEIIAATQKKLSALVHNLDSIRTDYQKFLLQLKEKNPELASMISVEPKPVEFYQAILPDSVLLLEYFTTPKNLYVWAVSNRQVKAIKQSVNEKELYGKIDQLRNAIPKQLLVEDFLKELYSLLIKPVEKYVNENSHLIIIPHGVLHYLPFNALCDDAGRYLIEKHTISLSPSAMVLSICMDKGNEFVQEKNWRPKVLALGNPDLGDTRYDLPFAKKEIESIGLLFPKVSAYLGKEAKETIVKEKSQSANLVLFSCHGEFDASKPLFSALLLTPDNKNDGRLEAHEIFNLNIQAYVVAMSACETGLSKVGVGDEVIGLSRSFIYAGASSLLSSLWKVDDLATALLIKRFFRYLRSGDSRARALQKAILFVKNNFNEHPIYWSAFNLTGDFR